MIQDSEWAVPLCGLQRSFLGDVFEFQKPFLRLKLCPPNHPTPMHVHTLPPRPNTGLT